jgi:hypothetical protein
MRRSEVRIFLSAPFNLLVNQCNALISGFVDSCLELGECDRGAIKRRVPPTFSAFFSAVPDTEPLHPVPIDATPFLHCTLEWACVFVIQSVNSPHGGRTDGGVGDIKTHDLSPKSKTHQNYPYSNLGSTTVIDLSHS